MSKTDIASIVSNRLVPAYEDFSFRLLSELVKLDAGKNMFISPFSAAISLAMTYNGAQGETEQAIALVLGLTGLSLQEVNTANESLILIESSIDPEFELVIANSLWASQGIALDSNFTQRLRDFYNSEVANLNFSDPEATTIINMWVAEKTQEKIKELVTPDLIFDAVLILLNAVYFKGTWSKKFDRNKTEEIDFTLFDGSRKPTPMMFQLGHYSYYENECFQAVSLPYGNGRVSMYIFLPRQSVSIHEFRSILNGQNWRNWITQFVEMDGDIQIPRFKVEYEKDLKDSLTELGMRAAFENTANFAGMGVGNLKISSAIQKTFIEVNEEGTEASAATAICLEKGILLEGFSMVVDHPFFGSIGVSGRYKRLVG